LPFGDFFDFPVMLAYMLLIVRRVEAYASLALRLAEAYASFAAFL